MYPVELTIPMAKDLTDFGFEGLKSETEVRDIIEGQKGTLLLVVNSVCGCAAANARPGAKLALKNDKKPDRCVTVFAGVDHEATQAAREYLLLIFSKLLLGSSLIFHIQILFRFYDQAPYDLHILPRHQPLPLNRPDRNIRHMTRPGPGAN